MIKSVLLLFTFWLGSLGLAQENQPETNLPTTFALPGETVYPEGVAYDEEENVFYVGSTPDGTIYRGDLSTGEVTVFAEGTQPTAFGMAVDDAGRLWVAGGRSGRVFVYDTVTGELIRSYSTPEAEATFLNDLTVTPSGVYVTDSLRPVLFRIPVMAGKLGEVEAWLEFTGALGERQGFNLNGITATPDGRYLITVQTVTGQLYRIDTETREVLHIDLGNKTVKAGDGILLDGHTLWVARSSAGVIAPVDLSEDYTSGTVGEDFSHPSFIFPTTIAKVDDSLLVVNSQFNNRGEGVSPELPFTVSRVEIPE